MLANGLVTLMSMAIASGVEEAPYARATSCAASCRIGGPLLMPREVAAARMLERLSCWFESISQNSTPCGVNPLVRALMVGIISLILEHPLPVKMSVIARILDWMV